MGGTRWDEITALTIFYPFDIPFPFLRVDLRCPVTVLVTDPLGRRTGCQTNGTTLEEIPDSWFSYATAAKSQSTTILNLIPLPNES